ncbi:MAG TPA: tetratricopeptide repeat protein, partial [Anaerolineae bacterium]|nr:tetratricopeptide repeat protein [Anaerolineae bacterium]
ELLQRFDPAALPGAQRLACYQWQGRAHYIRGEFQAALAAYTRALEVAANEAERALLLQLIARTYLRAGNYAQAPTYAERSLQLARALTGQAEVLSLAYNDLGWSYFRLGQLEQADENFSLSERAAQAAQRPMLKGDALLGQGAVAWKQNRLEDARYDFETCRRIFQECHVPFREANTLTNLGLLYHKRETAEQALAYYYQARALTEKYGGVYDNLVTLYNIAEIQFMCDRLAESEETYHQLFRLAQDLGHKPMLSTAYCGLADIALVRDDLHTAMQHAVQAQQIAEETGNRIEQLGVAYRLLGDVWLKLDDAERAIDFYEQSLPLLEQHRLEEDVAKARAGLKSAKGKLG